MDFYQRMLRQWMILICITLGPVFLVACGGGGGGGASGGAPAEEEPNPYLPTEEYLRLYYNISPAYANFLPEKKNVSGARVDVFEWPTGTQEYFAIEPDSIAWRGLFSLSMFSTSDGVYSGDIQLSSDLPLWSESMPAGNYSVVNGKGRITIKPTVGSAVFSFSGYRQFYGIESVTVPLGTFDAVHVSYDITISFTKEGYQFSLPFSAEYWFVQGIGIVKRIDNGYAIELTNFQGVDRDSDGVADVLDLFPDDGTEATDNDHDGTGDNGDADDDNDGVPDSIDALPFNSTETKDNDRDGVGDIADANDDNDTAPDVSDAFPFDRLEWLDTDGDGTGNNADTDDDGDGWSDTLESTCKSDALSAALMPADTDIDGICNDMDADDDNDGHADIADPFPLDAAEWLDTDKDGTGNNGDADDDNDTVVDTIDPQPLDSLIPGAIYTAAPVVMAGESVRVLLSGARFSAADTFYVDGVETAASILSKNTAEIHLLDPQEGDLEIAIRYDGVAYESHINLPVIAPVYYPYSVISHPGRKDKSYFDPVTQSVYVNTVKGEGVSVDALTRFRYAGSGDWAVTEVLLANLQNFSVSPDRKHIAALVAYNTIVNVGVEDFQPDEPIFPVPDLTGDNLAVTEFDYANRLFLSSSGKRYSYDLEPLSAGYRKVTALGAAEIYLYGAAAVDGSVMLYGQKSYGTPYPMVKYDAIYSQFTKLMSVMENITQSGITMSALSANINGSKFVVGGSNIYNSSYMMMGQLYGNANNSNYTVMDSQGQFVISLKHENKGTTNAPQWHGVMRWYDTSVINGQVIYPVEAKIAENIGFIRSLTLSRDGLTVFVLGERKMLVVPVWQIRENAIGSNRLCPMAGCNGIRIAEGMRDPVTGEVIIPEFDDEPSTIDVLSPRYAAQGNRYEILLRGKGFKPGSVVMFGDAPAATRYVNDNELWAMLPDLLPDEYQVTVDGHRQDAPYFKVLAPVEIGSRIWSVSSVSRELIHDPLNNVLYNFDLLGQKLMRINLADDSIVSVTTPSGTKDMTWCHGNGNIFLVNGVDVFRYDSSTLDMLGVVSPAVASRVECILDNDLFLFPSTSIYSLLLYDDSENNIVRIGSSISPPYGLIDGASLIGDRIYYGDSNISTGEYDREIYNAVTQRTKLVDWQPMNFWSGSWSDSGNLGVINQSTVLDANFKILGSLLLPEVAETVVVSPDGTRIFAARGGQTYSTLYEIVIDPENPTDFSVDATYNLDSINGTIYRMEISHDGNTVFIANRTAIVSVKVH